ncbi:MAG: hypothetical protein IPL31_07975 [Saprospiraceae bacterium]|nr:hypothetical protein [Saprospiraceae bacterium]
MNKPIKQQLAQKQIDLQNCMNAKNKLIHNLQVCVNKQSCNKLLVIDIAVKKISSVSQYKGILEFTATLKNTSNQKIKFLQGEEFSVYSGVDIGGYNLEASKKMTFLNAGQVETLTFTKNWERNLNNNYDWSYCFIPTLCGKACNSISSNTICDYSIDHTLFP